MSILSIKGEGNVFVPIEKLDVLLERLEKHADIFYVRREHFTQEEIGDGKMDLITTFVEYLQDWEAPCFTAEVKQIDESIVFSLGEDFDVDYEEDDFVKFFTLFKGLASNGRFDFSDHDGNEYSFEYDTVSENWEFVSYSEQFVSRSSVISFLTGLKDIIPDKARKVVDKKIKDMMEAKTILC